MLRWVQDTGKGSVQAGGFRALLRKWGCIQSHTNTNLVSEDDACFLEIHVWPFLVLRQAGPFTHWVQEQNIPQTVLCLEYTIKWQSVLKEATHINKKLNTKKQNGTTNTAQHTNSLLTRILRTIKWLQQLPSQSFSSLYLHRKRPPHMDQWSAMWNQFSVSSQKPLSLKLHMSLGSGRRRGEAFCCSPCGPVCHSTCYTAMCETEVGRYS